MGSSKKTTTQTQSTSNVLQNDNRVAATDQAIALASGAHLDKSFTDASQTSITAIDASDRSFTDASTVSVATTDSRDLSDHRSWVDSSDNSLHDSSQTTITVTDNSDRSVVNESLDAEVAQKAIEGGTKNLDRAADVLETQIRTSADMYSTAGDILSDAQAGVVDLLKLATGDAALAREQQTQFLSSFYRDRESADSKVMGDLIKYGAYAAIAAAAFFTFRRR